jgi:hypothetical protein
LKLKEAEMSKQSAFGTVLLVLVAAAFIAAALIPTFKSNAETRHFDESFDNGELGISANLIQLGETGFPHRTAPLWIPASSETLSDVPRVFQITDCVNLAMPENTIGVYVSTTFQFTESVEVGVPIASSGYATICVSQGAQVDVILWAKVHEE